MPTPRKLFQSLQRFHDFSSERVEVNVADQFHQVSLPFAKDGLVSVLEKVSTAAVTPIKVSRISCHQTPHERRGPLFARLNEEVKMVRRSPSSTDVLIVDVKGFAQPVHKLLGIGRIRKNRPPFDPSGHNMIEPPRNQQSRLTWHVEILIIHLDHVKKTDKLSTSPTHPSRGKSEISVPANGPGGFP